MGGTTEANYMLTRGFRYDEIRSLYIDQLASVWMEDSTTETTRASVERKIDSYVEGDLEYVTDVLSALWEIVNRDGEIKAPSSTPSSVSPSQFSLASYGSTYFAQSGRTTYGPHPLR